MPSSVGIESHRCWPLAVHEAAHAVLAVLLGLRLRRMEIDLRTRQGGTVFESGFPPDDWRWKLLVSLPGEPAQKRADLAGRSLCMALAACDRQMISERPGWQSAHSITCRTC